LWARAFDDLLTCPLRYYFSAQGGKSVVPYAEAGAEFQRRVLEGLRIYLKSSGAKKVYLDPGVRGQRTGGAGLKVCAKVDGENVCGRPDLVALFDDPLVALVVEVQMTGSLEAGLCRSFARLSFYAQGVHEAFGLPVSLALVQPERIAFVKVGDCVSPFVDDLKKLDDFESAKNLTKRLLAGGRSDKSGACHEYWRPLCESCGYRRGCPLSRG